MRLKSKIMSIPLCFALALGMANTTASTYSVFAEEASESVTSESVITEAESTEVSQDDAAASADETDGDYADAGDTDVTESEISGDTNDATDVDAADVTPDETSEDAEISDENLDSDSSLWYYFDEDGYIHFFDDGDDYDYDYGYEEDEKTTATVKYRVHVQDYGTQDYVKNGEMSGTSGEGKRLEGIWISLEDTGYDGGVKYRTHVQNIGWQSWVKDGEMSGTSGQAKRLEAIQIKLYGEVAKHYDIYYRVHAQDYGWLDWGKNGTPAGTAGQAKRLEAIQIVLVDKDKDFSDPTACSYIELGKTATGITGMVNYATHVQNYGDQQYVCDGSISGTSGEGLRLENIKIKLGDTGYKGGITYVTHVQDYGWIENWAKDGQASGSSGLGKRLEAIKIKLYGEVADHYDVYYRVHAQDYGWLDWACDGEVAGTSGYGKRLEAIQIMLVEKNSYSNLLSVGNSYGVPYVSMETFGDMYDSAKLKLCIGSSDRAYLTKAQCDARMTTITVPTWNFASTSSMEKVTQYRKLTVNKAVADYYYRLFVEIYNSADKPVIDASLYAYTYRVNTNHTSVLSTHAYGVAFDINAAYNPNGTPAKSYEEWAAMPQSTVAEAQAKAKTLYEGCTIVSILRDKYGLYWGGDYGGSPDAMHFEFFN
jgi:uncharacterized protein YjdB